MLLGAVADDLTGATDLSLMLAREGMRTVQVVGVPEQDFDFGDAQAVVVALKSRTIPADEAVQQSRAAAEALLAAGAEQIVFKYCSTFDSTPQGNIGPVAEALLDLVGEPLTIACPAFPANKRTIYKGHLFVGEQLLSDSPMKDHPLTPMRDANLVRVLQAQTGLPVGLVAHDVVRQGAAAIAWAFKDALARGERMLIVDAITDDDLREIGSAAAGMKLITGGSGIAIGLPENFRRMDKLPEPESGTTFDAPDGKAVILAGSCSAATRRQIRVAVEAGIQAFKIDPVDINSGEISIEGVLAWMRDVQGIPLVYSSAEPDEVRNAQQILGRERAGTIVEHFLAELAMRLRDQGYRRFLIAGGETSGAVVTALGVKALRIGPEIDPGVPWTRSLGDAEPLALALKSGNFGADDFFIKAWELLR
jgi:3-dehydrotetronate 4-kinase